MGSFSGGVGGASKAAAADPAQTPPRGPESDPTRSIPLENRSNLPNPLNPPSPPDAPDAPDLPDSPDLSDPQDHLIERNGARYAGVHLILDLKGAKHLDDIAHVESALREAVDAAGATLLHIHLHHFTSTDGVSGVAVLAESHISVHTWPEIEFAAVDVFMCGDTRPELTVPVFERAFEPASLEVREHFRGRAE